MNLPVPYLLRPVQDHEYPYSRGQVWAQPDEAAAVEIMRSVVANPLEARARAAAGRTLVWQRYTLEAVGRLMQARLVNFWNSTETEVDQLT
jgi:hypothetical protein